MKEDREATLTFTNAAPQYPGFNQGYWYELEEMVKGHMEKNCGAENAFFITGVAPGKTDRYLETSKDRAVR